MLSSPASNVPLVDSLDWLLGRRVSGEGAVRLQLLDDDVRSVQISLRDYARVLDQLLSGTPPSGPFNPVEVFHHAKVFVCAMRRVGRLAAALSANRSLFGPGASKRIKLAWQKKKALFDGYTDPRDAIEHIDGEIKGKTNWVMMNLRDDHLFVTESKSAPISRAAEQAAIELRNEIVAAVLSPAV